MTRGKVTLLALHALSFLFVVISFISLLGIDRYEGASPVWLAGLLFGLIGFLILWWQYILGIRFVSSLFSKDLVWTNNLHQVYGKYGFLLILLHPMFIYLDFILTGIGIKIPNLNTTYDVLLFFGQFSILILGFIWVTSALFRNKFSYRLWKNIHLLTYPTLILLFIHSTNLGTTLNTSDLPILRYFWYFLIITFFVLTFLRFLFQFGTFKYKYEVNGVKKVTQDVVSLDLMQLKGFIKPEIGEFIYLQYHFFGESHPYTVSHFDEKTNTISISAKNLGKWSRGLFDLKPGAKMYLDGPYGVFTKEAFQSSKPLVLLAGGIGITPFMRLIEYFSIYPDQNPGVTLFYGNKTIQDIAYKQDLELMKSDNIKIINILSNIDKEIAGYEIGFITPELLRKYLANLPDYNYFVCGPPAMVKNVLPALETSGIPKSQIYSEKFSL